MKKVVCALILLALMCSCSAQSNEASEIIEISEVSYTPEVAVTSSEPEVSEPAEEIVESAPTEESAIINDEDYGHEIGKYCPDFTVTGLAGDADFTLSEHKDKYVLINFWAQWCGPCVSAMPELERLANEFSDKLDVVAVCITPDDDPEGFIISKGWDGYFMQFALDTVQPVTNKRVFYMIGVSDYVPVTVIVSPDGRIIFSHTGGVTYDMLKDVIE